MCWIFGYYWSKPAATILEHGLQRLEYRGYDSAGMAVMTTDWHVELIRAVGRVSELSNAVATNPSLSVEGSAYTQGIAHTRWATHGVPAERNTHPHHDVGRNFFVVHNGIIENQRKLKNELEQEWYTFYSETDTEVVPALLAKYRNGNLLETIEKVLPLLHGAYALLISCIHTPWEMIGVKWGSPLIFGINGDTHEFFFSSDAQALAGYAKEVIHLLDGELIHLHDSTYTIRTEHNVIKKPTQILDISAMEASKGAYKHFMLKEIYEQPAIINRILRGRADFANRTLMAEAFHGMQDEHYERIILVGCGTSYNAGLVWAYWIEQLTGIQAKAEIASEYITKRIPTDGKTLHIFLSQSGETADSLEVLKHIKNHGGATFGIVNVVGSSIAHLTNHGLFMRAGFEIGVASTKAFTAQLICLFLLSLFLAKKRGLTLASYTDLLNHLQHIPVLIDEILVNCVDPIRTLAQELAGYEDMFFLGRGVQFPVACEWSLKMKEISYIHSEAYPAGELKHGPLALIDERMPCVCIAVDDELFQQNLSSISEVQARKGKVLAISNKPISQADRNIIIPQTHPLLMPCLTTIVTQLLAYHTADILGRDIDKPRNLAKSVTVK